MSTMELTEEMEVKRWSVPAWAKVGLYIALGALTYKGLIITYDEVKKATIKAKYSYISGVIADELDGKSFRLSPDLRDNKRHQFGDLTPAEMSMAIYTLSIELYQCESLRSEINSLTTGIETIRSVK